MIIKSKMTKEDNQKDSLKMEKKQPKEMVSFYCDLSLVNSLDDYIHLKKRELPVNKKKKLNRTIVFHLVLSAIMDNHEKKQNQSFLNELILKWQDE
jgi:hypothetical protein